MISCLAFRTYLRFVTHHSVISKSNGEYSNRPMINMLANFSGVETYDLSSLRTIFYGASPMPEAVLARAMQVFPSCEFVQGYGMTETSGRISLLSAKYHTFSGQYAGKIASAGQAAPKQQLFRKFLEAIGVQATCFLSGCQ
jgi:acyl-CoA synthetase (AMP-forming)/AMP-acid ligase II